MTSQTQKALKIVSAGKYDLRDDSQVPSIEPDEVLVRVVCVALNPFDAKGCDLSPTPGATGGADFSGEIVQLGSDLINHNLGVGDRVCGCVFGNNPLEPENGAFAEYLAVPAGLVMKIPDGMSYDQASTFGTGLGTVGFGFYHFLDIPMPNVSVDAAVRESGKDKELPYLLIYGGATATGTLAIQVARLSGYAPVTTCSPHNFELVKSLGAVAAFDYKSPTVGPDLRAFTHDTLKLAFDCISTSSSMAICYASIGSAGGQYVSLDPFPVRNHTRRSVQPAYVLGLTMFGKPVAWQRPYYREAKPEDREFAEKWYPVAQDLLAQGKIKSHKFELRQGGLSALPSGIDEVRKELVKGRKLVYQVGETVA